MLRPQILLRLSLIALGTMSGDRWTSAESPADAQQAVHLRVARLIDQLASPSFNDRQAADVELTEIGEEGRAALEAAADSEDPEVRLRITRLLKQLKIEALWQGSPVRFNNQSMLASTAIEAISQQTGNEVLVGDQYGEFADGTIDLTAPTGLFWPVIDDICRRSGNRFRPRYGNAVPGWVLIAGDLGQYPVAYAGPIRAHISSGRRVFIEQFDYEDENSETTHTLQFNVTMAWEDRFRLVAHHSKVQVLDLEADVPHHAMQQPPVEEDWQVLDSSAQQYGTTLKLTPPPPAATSLRRLSLGWDVIAVGDWSTLEIEPLTEGDLHRRDDVGLRVVEVKQTGPTRWELELAIKRMLIVPQPDDVLLVENEFEVWDQQGEPLTIQNRTRGNSSKGTARLTLACTAASEASVPARLSVHYPKIRDRRQIKIVFRDVPLPSAQPE